MALSLPVYEAFGRPGTIWRLPDLACPLTGLPGAVPVPLLASVAASVPMDMMDSDLPCLCPLVLLPNAPLGSAGGFPSPAVDGVFSESAGRCPRAGAGG